ncbi:Nucleotide-binding universal stress protein, UspA family [Catalinimonas alkaloidigena]|uniref:Nucleotide-binding universal stress protein, UspA family n=1 Tax=Catalinimonas alkaloidigena TaxID=1075417 RepID=A0A1G9NYG9_9BACT|nr:universal stress protein [Catalinimonas alkaloidigena]SDL91430.1 Nucleotide-binding universal stress protein, UspA family [Catalinimonas alkaloidigena]
MKKILVPLDFSAPSQQALHLAAQLARKASASLELMHVVELPPTYAYGAYSLAQGNLLTDWEEQAGQMLDTLRQNPDYADLTLHTFVDIGTPTQRIVQRARQTHASLIVMGSKGCTGLDELLFGSVAERVVRFAPCPVLVSKALVDLADIRRVVFVSDLMEEQSGVITALRDLLPFLGAELHVLYVVTPLDWVPSRVAEQRWNHFREQYGLEAQFHFYFEESKESGIRHFMEDLKGDMLAMGTHGRRGLQRFLAGGSLAEQVVNHTHQVIWTCPLERATDEDALPEAHNFASLAH